MQCQCPAAGYCPILQRMMGEHHHAICQHKVLTPAKCNVIQSNWLQIAAAQTNGPGTHLKTILSDLGIKKLIGCGCENKMWQMNVWGVDGCRQRFSTIRGWIATAQAKAGWATTITAAANAATSGLALQIDPLDIPGSLVRLAIERAEILKIHKEEN